MRQYSYNGDNPLRWAADRVTGGEGEDDIDRLYWKVQEDMGEFAQMPIEEKAEYTLDNIIE